MNWAASHLAGREEPQKLYNMEGVISQKLGETRKLLKKKRKGCLRWDYCPLKEGRGSYQADCLSYLWWIVRAYLTDYLIGADQKVPDRPSQITFLEKVETAYGQVLI